MSAIEKRLRVMYWAPTRRRHYASINQAARAEAGARIAQKYPYKEEGQHWSANANLMLVRERFARRIAGAYRRADREGGARWGRLERRKPL